VSVPAIRVEGLGKRFRIGERVRYKSLRESLTNAARRALRGERRPHETIWALKDVSFEVAPGEVVGVIGRNGAGKSTLLKILSRITEPTEGRVELRGRVGSLLEVGTGFHLELTGRENIYLNGAILGMKRAEIERKFDEIVAFAEIERFLDTPVKHYSTGMYLRLAFAVAAHLEPEILLVDEVLAVGDTEFQRKCLGKMDEVAHGGRTVLFVSHNLQAVSSLTREALLLEGGTLQHFGETAVTLNRYRDLFALSASWVFSAAEKKTGVTAARVITSTGGEKHAFGELLAFEFEIALERKPKAVGFSFQVVDETGRAIGYFWLFDSENPWARAGNVTLRCIVPHPRLYMGRYTLTTYLSDRRSRQQLEVLSGVCAFEVVMDAIPREWEWTRQACTYIEEGKWEVV
jgi:homopolymeric O-antigen transport system ATP-binding protein